MSRIPKEQRDKPASKRLRFEVFNRDQFTCQYCGAQPPDVVLECDHITPLSHGGATSLDNLITACEACNKGKSDTPLGQVAPRPDADLMYLKTQQEIVELQRFIAATEAKNEALEQVCEAIQERAWSLNSYDWAPAEHILMQLLDKYSPVVVEQSVAVVAKKIDDRELSSHSSRWVPFLWGVAKRVQQQMESE